MPVYLVTRPLFAASLLLQALRRYADTGFASHVLLEGYWEMWLTMFFIRHLQPGMTVIDVGANYGYYSVLFGALVEAPATSTPSSPTPRSARRLRRSIDLNGFMSRTTIVEAAAGPAETAEVILYAPHGGTQERQDCRVADEFPVESEASYKIPQVRLDKAAAGATRIDLSRSMPRVPRKGIIAGMQNILTRDRPGLILEFNAARCRDPGGFISHCRRYTVAWAISIIGAVRLRSLRPSC